MKYLAFLALAFPAGELTGQAILGRDSLALRAATIAVHASSRVESSWPRYSFQPDFVLCGTVGHALFVTSTPPPIELGKSRAISLGVGVAQKAYLYESLPVGLPPSCMTLRYRVGAHEVMAFSAIDSIYGISEPTTATVVLLYHEDFHRYQKKRFGLTAADEPQWRYDPLEAALWPPDSIVLSAEFQNAASLERQILASALEVTETDSLRAMLRSYLALRTRRTAMLPYAFRGSEAHEERKEGSAQLVGYLAGLAAVGYSEGYVVDIIRSDLLETPSFASKAWSKGAYRQWHIYASGSAIGLLLDRLGANWRGDLEQGATFVTLLARAVEP